MTGPEHYREAERLLALARFSFKGDDEVYYAADRPSTPDGAGPDCEGMGI